MIRKKDFYVAKKIICCRQKQVSGASKIVLFQQSIVHVAQNYISFRQNLIGVAEKNYFVLKKVIIFFGTARHKANKCLAIFRRISLKNFV